MVHAIPTSPESKPFQAEWVHDLRSRKQARITKASSVSLWDAVSTVFFPLAILRGLWWGIREGMDRLAGKLVKKFLVPADVADRDFNQFWAGPRSTLDKIARLAILPSTLVRPSDDTKEAFEQFWFKEPLKEENAVLRTAFIAERKTIRTPDGVTLQAVVYRSRNSDPATTPTVICCNPNLGLQEENGFKDLMSQSILDGIPCNFVTFNYRSAGGEEGAFTCEDDLYTDASSVVAFVKKEMRTPDDLIDLYGYSLGGAVAAKTQALHPELKGPQVSDRSFSSLEDWIGSKAPSPLGWLASRALKEKELSFDAASDFNKIQGRKLVLYHDQDPIVGYPSSLRNKVTLGNGVVA